MCNWDPFFAKTLIMIMFGHQNMQLCVVFFFFLCLITEIIEKKRKGNRENFYAYKTQQIFSVSFHHVDVDREKNCNRVNMVKGVPKLLPMLGKFVQGGSIWQHMLQKWTCVISGFPLLPSPPHKIN